MAAAAFAILIYYGIANLAALKMPRDSKIVPDAVPWIGLAVCVLLALSLPWQTVTIGLLILVVGVAVRLVFAGGQNSEEDNS